MTEKKRIIEYPFHLGDLAGGTSHFDNFEFGAYFRLMIAQIQSPDHDLPNDPEQLRRYARCTEKQWAKLWPLIKDKFPVTETGRLSHKRVKNTIDDIVHRSNVARDNRLKRKDTAPATVERSSDNGLANHITYREDTIVSSLSVGSGVDISPTEQPEKSSPRSIMYGELTFDQVFEIIWKDYPKIRDKGHKGKAQDEFAKAIKKGGKNEDDWRTGARTIINGVRRFRRYCESTGEKNPDAFRWIRDGGYDRPWDEPATGGRGSGYSLEAVHDKAVADTTRRPEGREERLKRLGLGDDTGND